MACGNVQLWQAIIVFVVLLLIALILVLQLNLYCLLIAMVTVCLTIVYPFCKRFTYLPQLVLGMVFNAGILMAYAAQHNHLPLIAWLLYVSTVIWTVAYDTMYALADIEDDLKLGLKSSAILFATQATKVIALLQILFLGGLFWVGYIETASVYYYIALLIAIILSAYQQYLISKQQPFKGFLNNNWLGFVVFIGVIFI